jgi:hypothetical protein
MVFPCIGSQTQVTICPALRTALIIWGNLTLMFSAPILAIIVILPGLLWGFRISMRLTRSFGSILLLTCTKRFVFSHQILLAEIELLQPVSSITKIIKAYFVCRQVQQNKASQTSIKAITVSQTGLYEHTQQHTWTQILTDLLKVVVHLTNPESN